ncbi:helix-turn-helix domain-containing protein [Candidatus Bipolaricaulota bacterium]|nr:helix-turn-helix domain-containing protein [Candidatus Bipolaricaulota bacterium]
MTSKKIGNTSRIASQAHSDLAIPPGEYLAEVMDELGLDRAEIAQKTGLPDVVVDRAMNGTEPITRPIAAQLENATGVPSDIWLGLEAEYRAAQTKEISPEAPS